MTTNETKELRRVRMMDMRVNKKMTLGAIAKIEQVTSQRVNQIIGNTAVVRPVNSRLIEIYRFIESYNARRRSPTIAEIANKFPNGKGLPTSTSVINYYLGKMEELEMIEPREPMKARWLFTKPLNRKRAVIAEMLKMEAEASHE